MDMVNKFIDIELCCLLVCDVNNCGYVNCVVLLFREEWKLVNYKKCGIEYLENNRY